MTRATDLAVVPPPAKADPSFSTSAFTRLEVPWPLARGEPKLAVPLAHAMLEAQGQPANKRHSDIPAKLFFLSLCHSVAAVKIADNMR